jgi:nitronate monooxygenase
MAGVSTPEMAAAVSNAGGLGGVAIGHLDVKAARATLTATQALTTRPFNVNLFCHQPAHRDAELERAWVECLAPLFLKHQTSPPRELQEVYASFNGDEAMLSLLLEQPPKVVSFHFGLPPQSTVRALKAAGILLLATATNLAEGRACEAAGIDAVVAQGHEAGGHRGCFDADAVDEQLSTSVLTRLLVRALSLPIVSAGGIMDGAAIAAALRLKAWGAQLGTAYVACPESSADVAYRQRLLHNPEPTEMTRAVSGRPARGLPNRLTAWTAGTRPPAYPVAYDAGKALHGAAKVQGENGYGAHWAGQGAPLARSLPAGKLTQLLAEELHGRSTFALDAERPRC